MKKSILLLVSLTSLSCTQNGVPPTPSQVSDIVNATTQAVATVKKDPGAAINTTVTAVAPFLPEPWATYLSIASAIGLGIYGAVQKKKNTNQSIAISEIDKAVSTIATSPTDHAALSTVLDGAHQDLIPSTMATAMAANSVVVMPSVVPFVKT